MRDFSQLREHACRANLDLVAHGLVLGTWGNASVIDRDAGIVAIKPSGVRYPELTPESIVLVDLDGKTVSGALRPSSDLPTHLEIYRAFAGTGGVAHTHSHAATAFAQACRPLPCLGTTHADHFCGAVPVTRPLTPAEIRADYERNTGRVIAAAFAQIDPLDVPAVLVAHHGPFTWGPDGDAAVQNSVVLEAVARLALDTLRLAPGAEPIPGPLLQRHFRRKHGAGAYYGQPPPPAPKRTQ